MELCLGNGVRITVPNPGAETAPVKVWTGPAEKNPYRDWYPITEEPSSLTLDALESDPIR